MNEKIYLKRKIYDKLLEWKSSSNGQTALLIEGAKCIGKSTIVEKFGKNIGTRYILHTKDLKVEDNIVYLPLYMAIFL